MSRSLNIVNVMLGKQKGGLEWSAVQYALALKEMGQKVTMVVHKLCPYQEVLTQNHIPSITCAPLGEYDILTKHKLNKKIDGVDPDILILHGNRAIKLVRRYKYPLLAVDHSNNLDCYTHLDALVALTQERSQYLQSQGKKVYLLPNMLDLTHSNPPQKTFHLASKRVIGFLGRLDEKKGIHIFLEALTLLKKDNIPFQVLIGGESPERTRYETFIQQNNLSHDVTFLGWVHDKKTFFEKIDIFCVPSTIESFGIVILEAWKEGVPVIGSTATGPAALLTHNQTGWIFQSGDPQALANTLKYVLKQPENVLQAVGKDGYKELTQNYSQQKVTKDLIHAIEEIVSHASVRRANPLSDKT